MVGRGKPPSPNEKMVHILVHVIYLGSYVLGQSELTCRAVGKEEERYFIERPGA